MQKIFIYDFDGTLTPRPITRFLILEKCGLNDGVKDPRWREMVSAKKAVGMNLYEAVYSCFLDFVSSCGYELNDDNLSLGADIIEYNKGVVDFLEKTYNLGVNSYIISSSIKVLLERTKVAKYFKDIYATTFKYDGNVIMGTDYLMSDVKKVEIVKEIMKDNGLDDCSDIVYVGDGLTDLYVMEFVKDNGGTSIFVYLDEANKELAVAREKNCVNLFTVADYSKGSELYNYMISLLER